MPLVSDNFHEKKLKNFGINIKTKYIVGNNIYERNTDDSVNDDITSGIRCEKDYYIGPNLVHKEKEFDSRIEYTFISKEMENKEYKCPNCGSEDTKDIDENFYCNLIYKCNSCGYQWTDRSKRVSC